MNLALVLGQNSESIKPKLASVKDNLNIECFVDLQHFIKSAVKRELSFDRVILVSTVVKNESNINDLYKYWYTYNKDMEVVLMCKSGSDDGLAKAFLGRFCSTFVTSMSVTSTTLHTLSEAVMLPIPKLVSMYGISDYLAVEVEDDSYEEQIVEQKQEQIENVKEQVQKTKGNRTLFGALFGKKKSKVSVENNQVQDIQTQNETSDDNQEDYVESQEDDSYTDSNTELSEDLQDTNNSSPTDSEYDEQGYEDDLEYQEEYTDFSEDNDNNLSLNDSDDYEDDFTSNNEEVEIQSQDVSVVDDSVADSFADDEDDDFDFTMQNSSNFEEDLVDDEDFGDMTYSENSGVSQPSTIVNATDEQVEDLDTDLSLASAEEEYRKKTEQPKVIKETVVKEVIKSVKTSTVLENIYKGVAHKLIIVTGDRGVGNTTTAWSLAMHFAQKVPVLYFDCDVETHGLMNYIDYFEFKNYEPSHMQGVKLCKSSQAFSTCVCKWDTNMDLLTTDFGVEVTDDELTLSQGIVAENLNKYGVVIVDCPVSKLHCIQDLILTGNVVLCVEDTKRGYMNALIGLDSSELPLRYKRSIISKGTLVRTKVNHKNDYKRVMKYINGIVDLEDCNWLEMVTTSFTGKVTPELLTEILEG